VPISYILINAKIKIRISIGNQPWLKYPYFKPIRPKSNHSRYSYTLPPEEAKVNAVIHNNWKQEISVFRPIF
jgi:hypothetical protein